MIYFVVLLLMLIPVVRFDLMQIKKGQQVWYYTNLIVLILLAGLRFRVGGDTILYMVLFESYPDLSELAYFDFEEAVYNPLWYILNSFSKTISDSFTVFQLFHATFVNVVFFSFFKRYTRYYFTAILIYYCCYYLYFNLEILREILCICILMLAYPYLEKGKWVRYYLCCVIALFIHYSAGLLLFFPLVFKIIKKENFWLTLCSCGVLFVTFCFVDVVSILLSFVLRGEGQLAILAEKYFEAEISLGGLLYQCLLCFPVMVLLYVHTKNRIEENNGFGLLLMVSCLIYVFSMFVNGFWRLSNYFVPFFIVYMVNTIYHMYDFRKERQVSTLCLWAAMCVFSFTSFYYYYKDASEFLPGARFYHIFYPYHSVLDPEIDEFREKYLENYRDLDINL